jgi:hypothetical protein
LHGLCIGTNLKDSLLVLGWDADFATEAYRQEVEALAQHQVHNINFMLHTLLWTNFNSTLCFSFFFFVTVDGGTGV